VGAAIRRHQRVRGGEERKGCRRDAMKSAEKNKKIIIILVINMSHVS
jgi:hypothetical protein